jgi:hypothetical protein
MKKLSLLLILVASVCVADIPFGFNPMGVPSWTPAMLNPVAWYRGDGNALDSSTNSYAATWSDSAAYATGKVGQAFELDGSTNYLTIPMNVANVISGQQFTLAMWIRPDQDFNSLGGGTQHEQAFLRECLRIGDNGIYNTWTWKIDTDTDRIQFAVFGNGSLVANSFGVNTTWAASTWYHIALVFDGVGYYFYLNGQSDGYTANSNTVSTTLGHIILIGRDLLVKPNSQMFDGLIDDVLVLGAAKSAAEILTLYNESIGKAGAAWK